MLSLFKTKPVLDVDATHWIFDAFTWSLRNFEADVFYNETILVTPTNQHFPGRENSIDGMANLILDQVKQYAGLQHWPCRLLDPNAPVAEEPPKVSIAGPLRGAKGIVPATVNEANTLLVPFNPQQISKPEALIASYAHVLAHYLATTTQDPPPGGEEFWPHATEIVAIFMGFGVMIANSAYTFRGGCGSCYNPLAERSAFLSQDEATYALALFCVLKGIPNQDVLPHIKKYLRPTFKNAVKEIKEKAGELAKLKSVVSKENKLGVA
ncbi:hypothetical protein [Kaarinaea lacus]